MFQRTKICKHFKIDRPKQFVTSLSAAAFTYEINTQKYVCVSSMYLYVSCTTIIKMSLLLQMECVKIFKGILLLMTIDFYRILKRENKTEHSTDSRSCKPSIYVLITLLSSFILLLPRFMEYQIVQVRLSFFLDRRKF